MRGICRSSTEKKGPDPSGSDPFSTLLILRLSSVLPSCCHSQHTCRYCHKNRRPHRSRIAGLCSLRSTSAISAAAGVSIIPRCVTAISCCASIISRCTSIISRCTFFRIFRISRFFRIGRILCIFRPCFSVLFHKPGFCLPERCDRLGRRDEQHGEGGAAVRLLRHVLRQPGE